MLAIVDMYRFEYLRALGRLQSAGSVNGQWFAGGAKRYQSDAESLR
jgi:hypothetical protein